MTKRVTKAQAIRRGTMTVKRILLNLIKWNRKNKELLHPADVVSYTLTKKEIEILRDFAACLSIYTVETGFSDYSECEKVHYDYDIVLYKGYKILSYNGFQTNYNWDVSLSDNAISITSRSVTPAGLKVKETEYKISLLDIYKILYPNTNFV